MAARLATIPLSALIFGFFLTAMPVQAERTVHEKGRVVYHLAKIDVMEAGDVPGHIIALGDQRGLITLESGEVGVWQTKVILDLTQGNGPHQSYTVSTYADRSTVVSKAQGVTVAQPDGTSTFEGTFVYIGGTGRYAGIQGGGRYAGKRLAPVTSGGQADMYQDYSATYTLP